MASILKKYSVILVDSWLPPPLPWLHGKQYIGSLIVGNVFMGVWRCTCRDVSKTTICKIIFWKRYNFLNWAEHAMYAMYSASEPEKRRLVRTLCTEVCETCCFVCDILRIKGEWHVSCYTHSHLKQIIDSHFLNEAVFLPIGKKASS